MPFAVNGNPIDLADKANPDVKFYHECIEMLKRKSGGDIVLDWAQQHIAEKNDDHRLRETAKGFRFPMNETVLRDGINKTWTYYEKDTIIGGAHNFKPRYYNFERATGFNGISANFELLFFMVFITPYCQKVPALAKYMNPNPSNLPASYVLQLPEDEAADAVEKGKKRAHVANMIYTEMNIVQIRTLAQSFGISGTERMKENMLRQNLVTIACLNDENIEKFLEDSNVNPWVQLRADVSMAIEKNIIKRNNRFGRPKWAYVNKEGKLGDEIVAIAKGEDEKKAKELLCEFYQNHPTDYEFLVNKLRPSTKKEMKSEVTD